MLSGNLYHEDETVQKFKFAEDIDSIRLNLAGKGILYEDLDFIYKIPDIEHGDEDEYAELQPIEWKRPKEICTSPKFIDCHPHRFDALQGKLGDCWVITAMQALTFQKTLVKHVVPPDQNFDENYIGAFHFRIWSLGIWYDVVVDDRLPVYKNYKTPCYCRSRSGNVFWAALLEKAYAKFWVSDDLRSFGYDTIWTGVVTTSLMSFSGGIVEWACVTPKYQDRFGELPYGSTLQSFLYEAHQRNALLSCVCFGELAEETRDLGIVAGHGYTITYICKSRDDDPEFSHDGEGLFLVRLLNPWGHHEFTENWSHDDRYGGPWKNFLRKVRDMIDDTKDDTVDDGEFWISDENFKKYFPIIYVCHLGPGQFADTRLANLPRWTTWKTIFINGEWVTGVSAAGSDFNDRHKLPQFGIELKYPKNAIINQPNCYVVIHLTYKGKYRRYQNCPPRKPCPVNDVGFYIYDTTSTEKTKDERLGKEFFEKNLPINDEPKWRTGDGRSYSLGKIMNCGTYCIVPCSHIPDMDAKFLLRIFTTNDCDDWEYGKIISKSLYITEENLDYTDNWVYTLFSDITQEQNEIDWTDLKCILDAAFNPNPSLFEIFTAIAIHILRVFGFVPTTRPSNYIANENVDFTKDQCRSMIAMLDYNHSGKLDFSEFGELWNKINFWIKVYNQHRDDTMGLLQVSQLTDALGAIGYGINIRAVHSLRYVYADDEGMILLTDFVLCGVALETALSCFEEETFKSGNKLTLTLEEWVKSTLIL